MTSSERAKLRSQANTLTPVFQIGKQDVGDNLIDAVDAALTKRELIKLTVLETASLSPKEAAEMLAQATGAEVIQCIGRKIVLYRETPRDPAQSTRE